MTFDTNQTFDTDRENANWPKTEAELEDHWKKLVSFELLNEVLQQVDANSSEEKLGHQKIYRKSQPIPETNFGKGIRDGRKTFRNLNPATCRNFTLVP